MENDKIVLSSEDVNNIEKFFQHFEINMPEILKKQIEVFNNNLDNYSLENQQALKNALLFAIVNSDHDLLKDDIFNNIRELCSKEWYNVQFDMDLEEILSEGEEK